MQAASLVNRRKHNMATLLAPLVAAFGLVVVTCSADAGLAVNVGNVSLNADQAGQERTFNFTGSATVTDFEFDIQVGDGGTDLGGTASGPRITSIDLVGSAFGSGGTQTNVISYALARQSILELASTTNLFDGVLAKVTFDTTGMLDSSSQSLLLSGVAGSFSTSFYNNSVLVPLSIANGTLTVVPEPASLGLLGLGVLLIARRSHAM